MSRPHRPRAGNPGSGRRFSDRRDGHPNSAKPVASQDHGWQPGQLNIYVTVDPREHDPSCSIPKAAHSAWLRGVNRGMVRCINCGDHLRIGTVSHPLMVGGMRFRHDRLQEWIVSQCLACCATAGDPDQAAAALAVAVQGRHEPTRGRVFVHVLADA